MKLVCASLIVGISVILGTSLGAEAGQVCMPVQELQATLIDWYQERPVGTPSDLNEQLWISDQTGSWTMVKTMPDGFACVTGQGDSGNQNELLAALGD